MLRVSQAAQILGIAPVTVRKWCNEGKMEYELSAAGQRIFTKEYVEAFKRKQLGIPDPEKISLYYVRSSSGNDVTMDTQVSKLKSNYPQPDRVFQDKSSGLNDKRKGLDSLIDFIKNNCLHDGNCS